MKNTLLSVVEQGLFGPTRHLPAWLFYDEAGSALYEQITELPEYYLTRAERSIFETQAEQILSAAFADHPGPWTVVELGAGTATKTQLLLECLVRSERSFCFMPVDVSETALAIGVERLRKELPTMRLEPLVAHHEQAFEQLSHRDGKHLILFIGSSIGNYEEAAAILWLKGLRRSLQPGSVLLLGTDLRKSPSVLVPAYDDAQGITAAFNKNILERLNRELGTRFELEHFCHVALWNEQDSRIEMHLESTRDQDVWIGERLLHFKKGERIHTESSVKYDLQMVERMLRIAGFGLERSFLDDEGRFAVHLARVV